MKKETGLGEDFNFIGEAGGNKSTLDGVFGALGRHFGLALLSGEGNRVDAATCAAAAQYAGGLRNCDVYVCEPDRSNKAYERYEAVVSASAMSLVENNADGSQTFYEQSKFGKGRTVTKEQLDESFAAIGGVATLNVPLCAVTDCDPPREKGKVGVIAGRATKRKRAAAKACQQNMPNAAALKEAARLDARALELSRSGVFQCTVINEHRSRCTCLFKQRSSFEAHVAQAATAVASSKSRTPPLVHHFPQVLSTKDVAAVVWREMANEAIGKR